MAGGDIIYCCKKSFGNTPFSVPQTTKNNILKRQSTPPQRCRCICACGFRTGLVPDYNGIPVSESVCGNIFHIQLVVIAER